MCQWELGTILPTPGAEPEDRGDYCMAINSVATRHYDLCMQIGQGKGALGTHE